MDKSKGDIKEPSRVRFRWYWVFLAALVVAGVTASVVIFRDKIADLEQYGYLGAFLISILASSTIVALIPTVPVIFTLGGILNPYLVALVAGMGEAIGEFTSYIAGRSGHAFFKGSFVRIHTRLEKWIARRGSLALFLSAAVFNPFFSIVGATAGAFRFPPWKFFLIVWAGKTVKWTIVAVLGQLVLVNLLHWLS